MPNKALHLTSDCNLDYHTPIHAVALACPSADYIKLWPLPVVYQDVRS
jgi:hypothetical protein